MKTKSLLLLFFLATFTCIAQINEKIGIGVYLKIDSTGNHTITKINGVVADGPAQKIGLQEGDIILEVEGQSTQDLELQKVAEMIGGKEGSTVKLLIDRNGSKRDYTIQRLKFKYAGVLYKTSEKDDDFCLALTTLMNDAGFNFDNTIDTNHFELENKEYASKHFESKVKVPEAKKVYIDRSWGTTCYINFGSFKTMQEVNAAGTPIVAKIKTCFPDYYYNPVVGKKGDVRVEIGKNYTDGFESPILELFFFLDDSLKTYQLDLEVNSRKTTRYFQITTPEKDNSFTKSVRTIFNDISLKYRNVKGTKHETPADPHSLFSFATVSYDIVPLPAGAHDCFLSEGGGMQLDMSNGCTCRFYLGHEKETAKAAYNKVLQELFEGLGSEFSYTYDKQRLDMTIPDKAESFISFGIKKTKGFESGPIMTLVLVKYEDNRYAVNLLFHDYGF
jgi:hypothetical protein